MRRVTWEERQANARRRKSSVLVQHGPPGAVTTEDDARFTAWLEGRQEAKERSTRRRKRTPNRSQSNVVVRKVGQSWQVQRDGKTVGDKRYLYKKQAVAAAPRGATILTATGKRRRNAFEHIKGSYSTFAAFKKEVRRVRLAHKQKWWGADATVAGREVRIKAFGHDLASGRYRVDGVDAGGSPMRTPIRTLGTWADAGGCKTV